MGTTQLRPYTVGPDEKVAQVMVYTASNLYWGEIVVKSIVRVSTWLRTNTVPDRINLHNAMALVTGSSTHPVSFREINIAVSQIQAFHQVPPSQDPPDYDPTEPNRKMEPVQAIVNSYVIKGHLRLSMNSDMRKFLEVSRETYSSIYDAQITNLAMANFRGLTVPYVLVRQENTAFTSC